METLASEETKERGRGESVLVGSRKEEGRRECPVSRKEEGGGLVSRVSTIIAAFTTQVQQPLPAVHHTGLTCIVHCPAACMIYNIMVSMIYNIMVYLHSALTHCTAASGEDACSKKSLYPVWSFKRMR